MYYNYTIFVLYWQPIFWKKKTGCPFSLFFHSFFETYSASYRYDA